MTNEFDLLREMPDEDQLGCIDFRLIQLRGEKESAEGVYYRGRNIALIDKDINNYEYHRKLLIDRLSVKNSSDSSKKTKIIQGDSTSMKWYEKPLGILILAIVGGVIVGGLLFWFGWS